MSAITGTWTEALFVAQSDHTAVASTASEASLIAGTNKQAWLPAGFFDAGNRPGRAVEVYAAGILGTTGTPTITFQVRLGTTSGSSYLSGTSVAASAAITTGSGVSNKMWELYLRLTARTLGIGTGNTTLSGNGWVYSPGGFASPFKYAMTPGGGESATWTSTIDQSLTQYMNLSITWSASSSSNTATLKEWIVRGLN